MKSIDNNTVPAKYQTAESGVLSFCGEEGAGKKILIVGNSITRHGPKSDIGWSGDWGMAASCEEKDYIHILDSSLRAAGKGFHMCVRQSAEWEMNFTDKDILSKFDDIKDYDPDITVFRLGENIHADAEKSGLGGYLDEFLKLINPRGNAVIFTTCFWKNESVDTVIRTAADNMEMPCIELGDLGELDEMKAVGLFTHGGVAAHPGDKGMEEISCRITSVLDKFL